MDNLGTLTLRTIVNVCGREKHVTLATMRLYENECEGSAQEFMLFNPQLKHMPIFAEFVRRERIIVRAE